MADEFLTITETASTLGVSTRHARRLADSGALTRIARGLVDRDSVDRYVRSRRQGRTRAWAEHTAWGAAALLSGRDADWLGPAQVSRLRQNLRGITEVDDLLTRMRDRSRVHIFEAHRAALPRLRNAIITTDLRRLGITDAVDDSVDGYLAEENLAGVIRALGLRADTRGSVVLRTTGFDFGQVHDLLGTTTVAALDIATSSDPRQRAGGRNTLAELLAGYR